MRFVYLILIVITLTPVAHASDPCKGDSYGEKRDCVKVKLKRSDRELNNVYKELHRMIRKAYAGEKVISAEDVKQALVRSQKAWIQFRDKECDFRSSQAVGGTGTLEGFVHTECQLEITEIRTKRLKGYINDLRKYMADQ